MSVAHGALSHPDICDVFVKVGGSVLDDPGFTAGLIPVFVELSRQHRIVAMTGGGRGGKPLVSNQRTMASDFLPSWKGGITSLDVHAGLLASYSPAFAVVTSVYEIADR